MPALPPPAPPSRPHAARTPARCAGEILYLKEFHSKGLKQGQVLIGWAADLPVRPSLRCLESPALQQKMAQNCKEVMSAEFALPLERPNKRIHRCLHPLG